MDPGEGRTRGAGEVRCRPTDWGELGRTERTGDVVHIGRGHLPLASLASCFATVWDILLSGFDSSVEEGDGGGGGGGSREDWFTVDCRRERGSERMRTLHSVFFGVWGQSNGGSFTRFDRSPVAQRSIVLGLRVLEVHAVDGAAVHGGGALPRGLGPGGVVGDVGADGRGRRRVGALRLR